MPKPFWINPATRNFIGSGTRFGTNQTPHDRRVDWTTNQPPTPAGTWEYTNRVQIYTVREARLVEAKNLSGQVLITNYLQQNGGGEEVGPKLLNKDGSVEWTIDTTGMSTTLTGRQPGWVVEPDGLHAWCHWGDEDGTFVGSGRSVLQRIRISDGVTVGTFAQGDGELATGKCVEYFDTDDRVVHLLVDGGNEIVRVEGASAGSPYTKVDDANDSSVGNSCGVGKDTGENYMIVVGDAEDVGFYDYATYPNTPTFEVIMDNASYTPNFVTPGFDRGLANLDTAPQIHEDRINDGHFFISQGADGLSAAPYIWKGDTALGAVDATTCIFADRDVGADTNLTGDLQLRSIAVDKLGRPFCLVGNRAADGDDFEIVVLSNDLSSVVTRFGEDLGLTTPSGQRVLDISVDEENNVTVTDEAGYVILYNFVLP